MKNNLKLTLKQIPSFIEQTLPLVKKYKIVFLNGEMGSGKTTLVKAYSAALKKELIKNSQDLTPITSPTFNVMNVYEHIIHIDAYKIRGSLEEYEDYFENKIVFIEWAQNLNLDYQNYLTINIEIIDEHHRQYQIKEHN